MIKYQLRCLIQEHIQPLCAPTSWANSEPVVLGLHQPSHRHRMKREEGEAAAEAKYRGETEIEESQPIRFSLVPWPAGFSPSLLFSAAVWQTSFCNYLRCSEMCHLSFLVCRCQARSRVRRRLRDKRPWGVPGRADEGQRVGCGPF